MKLKWAEKLLSVVALYRRPFDLLKVVPVGRTSYLRSPGQGVGRRCERYHFTLSRMLSFALDLGPLP